MNTRSNNSITFLLTASLLFLLSCESMTTKVPREMEAPEKEFFGNVRKITEYTCRNYSNYPSSIKIFNNDCKLSGVFELDRSGTVLVERKWYSNYSANLPPDNIKINKVNDIGQIIETYVKSTGSFQYEVRRVFTYNKAGFLTEKAVYSTGVGDFYKGKMSFSGREEILYDDYNCPIKKSSYDKDNQLEYYWVSSYDNKNREILKLYYDKNEELDGRTVTKYGKDGKWSKIYRYDRDGKLTEEMNKDDYTLEYYTDGKLKSKHFRTDKNEDIYITYDHNERMIERKEYKDNKWIETETWNYREDGALLQKNVSTSKYSGIPFHKTTTNYKVDFYGNWIEKYTVDYKGTVHFVEIRDIEYY